MTSQSLSIAAVTAFVSLCLPNLARAERVDLQAMVGPSFVHSSSFDAISDHDTQAMSALTLAVPIMTEAWGELAIDAEYETGRASGTAFSSIDTETTLHAFTAGARYTRPLTRRVRAQARVGLGIARQAVSFSDSGNQNVKLEDVDALPIAGAVLGIEYTLFDRPTHRFGLRSQLSYRQMPSQNVRGHASQNANAIDSMSVDLGSLNTSAWGMRFGAFFAF